MEALLQAHEGAIAAIIVEPVPNAGGIPLPLPGYLQGLRDLADRYGALLIFDEVVTLRLHVGGYQALAGVTPDLTAHGQDHRRRIRGGRIRRQARDHGAVQSRAARSPGALRHIQWPQRDHGGRAGQPAAAGSDGDRPHQRAWRRRSRRASTMPLPRRAFVGSTTSVGSLVQVHWRTGPITNMADVGAGFNAAGDLPTLLHLELMNRGLYAAARGEYNISTAMTEADITRAVDTFSAALHVLKPYVVEAYPALHGG